MDDLQVRTILSGNLRRLRKQRGLSQLKLANELQMAMTFINDIENCKKWVSPETLARFANFYNISVAELFQTESEQQLSINAALLFETLSAEFNQTLKSIQDRFMCPCCEGDESPCPAQA